MIHKKKYQYPWRYNNSFQLLVDGDDYFSSMLDEIKKAQTQILLEAYLFESGNIADIFIKELCAAKERNIDIFILLDEYGTRGLSDSDKGKLTKAGIELLLYNPASFFHFGRSLKRDHRKLLTIDGRTAFIGGAGITDEFTPNIKDDYWHDVMIKVDGDIVFDLIHSFNMVWGKQKETLEINNEKVKNIYDKVKSKSRVLISAGTEENEISRALIAHIRSSKKRVWLISPYFISSWKIRRALRHAAKRGVDVRLVFPGPHSDHKWVTYGIQRYYQRLLKANVAVYEFQPRFIHAKIILCDDWFTLGSSNFDRWDQLLNLDVNIEIYDEQSRQQVIKLFKADFSKSTLIILNKWSTRSWLQHIREWVAGVVIRGLGIISRKFKR
ncbi:MAG: phosphatidylserine/phosphatidylglycerophosphate/cardiolipin synthase family protein [Gammaproteobacteria bacterium]|nr:phosphatidylserine/phosphatidylglycerophosphate/cardiolipin synthase family protein [Gammaproteobacteria bacterium]